MNESSPIIDSAREANEDQRAVTDYFASAAYTRAKSRRTAAAQPPKRAVWPDRVLTPGTSFGMGLIGLSVLLGTFSMLTAITAGGLRNVMDAEDGYIIFTLLDQTIMYPLVVSFAFAVVTPMFWYGSILTRFSLAMGMILPATVALLVFSGLLGPSDRLGYATLAIVLAMFLVMSAVTVLLQMWSHWTLSHSREIDAPLAPASTRSIMELTGITAVCCTLLAAIDTSAFTEILLLSLGMALLTSLATLSALIAYLRPQERNYFAAAMSVLFAFGGSFVYSGMNAFDAFGWDDLPKAMPAIIVMSIYGTVVFACLIWIHVWWLRGCGWACLNHAEEKHAREENKSPDPWSHWFRTEAD